MAGRKPKPKHNMAELMLKLSLLLMVGTWCLVTWAALYQRSDDYRRNIQPEDER